MPRFRSLFLILTAAVFAQTVSAQQDQTYNRVNFTAHAERQVENDTLIAIVYAEAEDNDQAEAANGVNEAIDWAASRARGVEGIELRTMRYSTRPVYASNSRRIVNWIARQSLRLESKDAEALSSLLGELQTRLAIESLTQELSRETSAGLEDELTIEALAEFRHRAELVADEMGRDGYRVVSIGINSSGALSARSNLRGLSYGADAVAPPTIETGVQLLSVTINGSIELRGE